MAAFLNQVMGLNLSAWAIAALETRTEGWIAGLQLAALSMQAHDLNYNPRCNLRTMTPPPKATRV